MEDVMEEAIPAYSNLSPLSKQNTQVRNVSLKRVEDVSRIAYISAIALQQSIHKDVQSVDLANYFIQHLFKAKPEAERFSRLTEIELKSFLVKVIPPGFIWFELSDRGVAAWLQHLINPFPHSDYAVERCIATNPPIVSSVQALSQTENDLLFATQHIHARCCSLLRLAAEQGLVTIAPSKNSLELGQILSSPIPWFRELASNSVALSPQLGLRLVHPSELALIGQLFSLLDLLCATCELEVCGVQSTPPSQKNWLKQLDRFNQAFHTFYRNCRIWEEVKRDLPLAQVRLGLLAATRIVLQMVLRDALGVAAPSNL
jgi:hypothetical protein